MESKKITHKLSKINKVGSIANNSIQEEEIVYIKEGHIISRSELFSSSMVNSYLPISDDYVIGANSLEEENDIKLYNNHSCRPNCRLRGEITFVAIKDIAKREELTIDYAFVDNERYRFKCNCGEKNCRKIITGYDWQIDSIQSRYSRKHFSSYIQSKILSGVKVSFCNRLDERIQNLRTGVFVNELGFDSSDEFDGEETDYRHCCLYVKNELAAYARVKFENNTAHISRLIVRKEERGKGYGKQIIFWAETEALKAEINQVYVHSLVDKVSFYEKLGYQATGAKFFEDGVEHIKMAKELTLN